MKKYRVRVWIDEIDIEAYSEQDACDKVCEKIDSSEVRVRSEYAEAWEIKNDQH